MIQEGKTDQVSTFWHIFMLTSLLMLYFLKNNCYLICIYIFFFQVITQGGVTYRNDPWHRECFTCTHCQKSLAGQRFTSRDDKPYCADCFGELFSKRCTACSKPITGIQYTIFNQPLFFVYFELLAEMLANQPGAVLVTSIEEKQVKGKLIRHVFHYAQPIFCHI